MLTFHWPGILIGSYLCQTLVSQSLLAKTIDSLLCEGCLLLSSLTFCDLNSSLIMFHRAPLEGAAAASAFLQSLSGKTCKTHLAVCGRSLGVNSSPQLILLSYCLWPNILQKCLEIFEICTKRTLPWCFTMFTNITSRASWMTIVTRRNVTTIASTQFSFLEGWVTVSALRL